MAAHFKTGRPSLIVCGELVRAVKQESVAAVAHHWGVCETTVWKWRIALGVGRMTEGTTQLYRDLVPSRLPPEKPPWDASEQTRLNTPPRNRLRVKASRQTKRHEMGCCVPPSANGARRENGNGEY